MAHKVVRSVSLVSVYT